jgi:hypothetical protein
MVSLATRLIRPAALGLLVAGVGGCSGGKMPTLASLLPPVTETSSTEANATPTTPAPGGPYETSVIVSGTPTGVFAEVAQGTLGCWFGPGGPLKASHVYRAEAEPPAKGGDAEIVIHERDTTLRDQRGTRAYRIVFASEASGVRVTSVALKFEVKLAEGMAQDVSGWAREGAKSGGCRLRALMPPPAPPVLAKAPGKAAKSAAQTANAPGQKGVRAAGKGPPPKK